MKQELKTSPTDHLERRFTAENPPPFGFDICGRRVLWRNGRPGYPAKVMEAERVMFRLCMENYEKRTGKKIGGNVWSFPQQDTDDYADELAGLLKLQKQVNDNYAISPDAVFRAISKRVVKVDKLTLEQKAQRAQQVARSLDEIDRGVTWNDIYFSDKKAKIRRRWPEGTIIDAKAQTITVPGKGWSTFEEWWESKQASGHNGNLG